MERSKRGKYNSHFADFLSIFNEMAAQCVYTSQVNVSHNDNDLMIWENEKVKKKNWEG